MRALGLFWTILVLFGSSCASKKNATDTAVLSLQRTACYGTCPIYTIELFADGKAKFTGERFTEKLGTWEKQFDYSEVSDLLKMAKSEKWPRYSDEYRSGVSDLPSNILGINRKNKSYTIRIEGEHPEALDVYTKALIRLAESDGWINLNLQ
jgi:hypothetical protein